MVPESEDPNKVEALQRKIAELQAQLAATQQANVGGSGAAAQGGGDALGERSVKLEDNAGTIVTGTQIVTNYYAAAGGRLSKEQIAEQVVGYLRWLRSRTESIELRGIERAGGAPVVLLPLDRAYVPLRARSTSGDIELNEVLGLGHRLVIVGGPGSGKTTVLLHMAWALASSLLAGEREPAISRLGLKIAPGKLPLPIFVPLASFARYRRNLPPAVPARDRTLAHFITYHLISKQADFDLPADFFVQLLKKQEEPALAQGPLDDRLAPPSADEDLNARTWNVLLLLDGLDEVSNEGERAEVRQSVEELVSGRDDMRVIVTCRTVTYRSGRTALGAGFREIAVQPLDFTQHIAPMVRQAYACIHPHDAALRDTRATDLLDGVRRLEEERRARLGEHAEALVDSPLMVRLLLIVHVNNRRLPDERADLFDKAINALLQVDYGRDESDIRELSTDWKLFRDMAQHLAFHMHQQGRDQGREIEEPALKAALRSEAEFKPRIDDFLSHARQRGSVIEERGGAYRFIHLAFQEFLVARYLREVTGGEGLGAILAFVDDYVEDPWWREPILLLASYLGANAAKAARSFLRALANAGNKPNAQFSAAELAGTAALAWPESGATIRAECAQRIVGLLGEENTVRGSRPVMRYRTGDTLARLGDPRFDPQRFSLPADDLLGFVRIPADPAFKIGTRQSDVERVEKMIGREVTKNEINEAVTPTPEFYIGRYPVTVAQYRAFLEAIGFARGAHSAMSEASNRPVCFVDWHEALAYCQWLNEALGTASVLGGSEAAGLVREGAWQVTLPSELEWEKAARGGLEHAVFSWGDTPHPNRANFRDSENHETSAVGCFPPNGFGLHDMLDNVWEWTRSLWGKDLAAPAFAYPDDPRREALDEGDELLRVLRGGSWDSPPHLARCAYRRGGLGVYRNRSLGFRVVLRSAPLS